MAKSVKVASPAVEFTPVTIDGREYSLSFSFNGLIEAERETKENLLQGVGKIILGGMTAAQYRGVFYASLRTAHPDITLDQAGAILQVAFLAMDLERIREALLTTYHVSFKKTEDPPAADPPAENSGS